MWFGDGGGGIMNKVVRRNVKLASGFDRAAR